MDAVVCSGNERAKTFLAGTLNGILATPQLAFPSQFACFVQVVDIIHRSWNMTPDGQGTFLSQHELGKCMSTSRRAQPSRQQSSDARAARSMLTDPRLTGDSVSEMLANNTSTSAAASAAAVEQVLQAPLVPLPGGFTAAILRACATKKCLILAMSELFHHREKDRCWCREQCMQLNSYQNSTCLLAPLVHPHRQALYRLTPS